MKIQPDILATIHLYNTEIGGKKYPIKADYREYFGCPIAFEKSTKQCYDCRIYLPSKSVINPGDIYRNLPIKFLCWELVKPLIAINKKFYLWEGEFIGEGTIELILASSELN